VRWACVGALVLVALLYYRPLRNYVDRRAAVAERRAEVRVLEVERNTLERRYRYVTSEAAIAREGRRLGYVKPGELLFIVKEIPRWEAERRRRATIAADG
jgi:cell division protein FtsB